MRLRGSDGCWIGADGVGAGRLTTGTPVIEVTTVGAISVAHRMKSAHTAACQRQVLMVPNANCSPVSSLTCLTLRSLRERTVVRTRV